MCNQTWMLWPHGFPALICVCLNVVKSNAMLIESYQKISVGDAALKKVSSIRYYGHPDRFWSLHVNNAVARVRSRLSSIYRYDRFPPAMVCLLYSAFALPL